MKVGAKSWSRQARPFSQLSSSPLPLLPQDFQTLELKLGINKPTDWYYVSRHEVARSGGVHFLKNQTISELVTDRYPQIQWEKDKFIDDHQRKPHGYWKRKRHLLDALENAEIQMGILKPNEWHSVQLTDLHACGFPTRVSKIQLSELLSEKYPDHNWEKIPRLQGRYAQQNRLEAAITALFPDVKLHTNARKEAGIVNPETGSYLELDIYLPSMRLAFEFQERHHYATVAHSDRLLDVQRERDALKKELAAAKNITLITVPCWWDGTLVSLAATIQQKRPEIKLSEDTTNAKPIPEEIPDNFFAEHIDNVPDIGEPTTACFFTNSSIDPSRWWIFEKYDGVRGFWNPLKKTFFSRKGNAINIPKEITDTLPENLFLDGELWFGRDSFGEAAKMTSKIYSPMIDWTRFQFMVFDIPNHNGAYRERYLELVKHFGESPCKYVTVAEKEECKDIQHLEKHFQDILDKGGEGIVLRDPNSLPIAGRSPGYLKHKKFRDAEARIVRQMGKYQWECELPNGIKFVAGANSIEFATRWQPQPGDIVSFKYTGWLLATQKPKLPTLYRMRNDISWEEVVLRFKEKRPSNSGGIPLRRKKRLPPKEKGYWQNSENRRNVLCDFAQEMGFSPTSYTDWQNVKRAQFIEKKGSGLLSAYGGSLRAAVRDTLIFLNYTEHPGRTTKDTLDESQLRKQLDIFASRVGFDALDVNGWYSADRKELAAFLEDHDINVSKTPARITACVQQAYPELRFLRWTRLKHSR